MLVRRVAPRACRSAARTLARWRASVAALAASAADAVFDPRCIAGEHALGRLRGPACDACVKRLHAARTRSRCGACSASVGSGTCAACLARPRRLIVHAPCAHADEARAVVLAMKARRREEAATLLASITVADAAVRAALDEADIIVPAPADPVRRRERGFDPAASLAREIARLARARGRRIRAVGALRARSGGKQSSASAAERRRALAGRFALRLGAARRVRDRRVVLVDDVVTTGATAVTCARLLLRAGATRVTVVACTRAEGPLLDVGQPAWRRGRP